MAMKAGVPQMQQSRQAGTSQTVVGDDAVNAAPPPFHGQVSGGDATANSKVVAPPSEMPIVSSIAPMTIMTVPKDE